MSQNYPSIILKKGKEASLIRKHLWVFSGAIAKKEGEIAEGSLVRVLDATGHFLAVGFYSEMGSIAIRVVSFLDEKINIEFFKSKINIAINKRKIIQSPHTNIYRLFHGEADGIPALIIDQYHKGIVVQAHSMGIHHLRKEIAEALLQTIDIESIYYKSKNTLNKQVENEWLFGNATETIGQENGRRFRIDWVNGQKTGFYIDQKDNRELLHQLKGVKTLLNTFCYSGGFSVSVPPNIEKIVSVDSSKLAIEICNQNIALNGLESAHEGICQDVFEYLQVNKEPFDIVILDPPAFAKHIGSRHQAIQAYKRLNKLGIQNTKIGGMLMTYSCSQVVDRELFEKTVYSAALESGRNISILAYLSQSKDHPINIYHPEGNYLKGLLLYIE